MKKVHAVLFAFLMMTMSLAGCLSGDDGGIGETGAVGEAGSSLHLVVTADELPDCNTTLLGQIFFVSGEGAFQVCSTTGWAVVDLTGPEGPAGSDGLDGADGADGTDGSPSPNTMLTSVTIPDISLECTAGGHIIAQGLDNGDGGGTTQNGILEAGEVDYKTTYCSKHVVSQIADINPGNNHHGANYSDPGRYMNILVGDTIYFDARNNEGRELWAHDTTSQLTWQVADIHEGYQDSDPGRGIHILVGDTIYFDADDGNDGTELWAHNSLNHTTWQVANIQKGYGGPGWFGMKILVDDTLYFSANDGTVSGDGTELWAHDTSNHSTWQVADIDVGDGSSYPGRYMTTLVGDTIYFDAEDENDGKELWAHDTSNHSTWQVADIHNNGSSYPGAYLNILVGDTIYFDARNNDEGRELWAHDTSNHSTWQVADINNSGGSNPGFRVPYTETVNTLVGDTLYFSADDGNDGIELWAHDTSNHSTWQVADINNTGSSNPGAYMMVLVGDTIYFDANDSYSGIEFWAHDTSNHSTWKVADIHEGYQDSDPGMNMYILVGDTIYFDADDGNDGTELWAHNSLNHSTWQMADINGGAAGSHPLCVELCVLVDDTLYFSAHNEIDGRELWAITIQHSISYD